MLLYFLLFWSVISFSAPYVDDETGRFPLKCTGVQWIQIACLRFALHLVKAVFFLSENKKLNLINIPY